MDLPDEAKTYPVGRKRKRMSPLLRLIILILVVSLFVDDSECYHPPYYPTFQFKRFPYRKKQKNERKLRTIRNNCENDGPCSNLYGLDSMNCVRRCMSNTCFYEVYAPDPIEEGEIDVRYNSFKGCILEKLKEQN